MQGLVFSLANHLWQSTIFVAAIAVVCLARRSHTPRLRYWLWLGASLKFLIPFSILVSLGASFERPSVNFANVQAFAVAQASYAFAPVSVSMAGTQDQAAAVVWPTVLLCLWAAGFLGIAVWRFRQWRSLSAVRRRKESVALEFLVPAVEADSLIEPGIFGIVRPVLLLPRGLRDHLTDEQFETLMAHELCHVQYRDSMTAAMHMAVEALFWFYPPVWWIGAKLVAERERACDQSVLARGGSAEVYATSILNVCRRYLESPLPCTPGITGAELKTRIQEIMTRRTGRPLSATRKAALVAAALVALFIPVAIGVLRIQDLPPLARRADNEPGKVPILSLLAFAYDVPAERFADVPEWAMSEKYDVSSALDLEELIGPGMSSDQVEALMSGQREHMQALLRDRFGLVLREEIRELPFYALTITEGGPKLTPAARNVTREMVTNRVLLGKPRRLTATGIGIQELTEMMSNMNLLGLPVVDETGLSGEYDVDLAWTPDPSMPPPGPRGPVGSSELTAAAEGSIFAALKDQLGIQVEPRRGSAPLLVVEHIEKPQAN